MSDRNQQDENDEFYLNLNLVLNDMDENETGVSPWEKYQHHIESEASSVKTGYINAFNFQLPDMIFYFTKPSIA